MIKQGRSLVEGREGKSGLLSLQELEKMGLVQVDKDDDVIRYRFYLKHQDFDGKELLANTSVMFALAKVAQQSGDIGLQRKVIALTAGTGYGVTLDDKLFNLDRSSCMDGCVASCGGKSLKVKSMAISKTGVGYEGFLSFNKLKQFFTEFKGSFVQAVVEYVEGYGLKGVTGYVADVVIIQDGKYKQVQYTLLI